MTPEDRFDALVGELVGIAGVPSPGSGGGFGSALRLRRKTGADCDSVHAELGQHVSRGIGAVTVQEPCPLGNP